MQEKGAKKFSAKKVALLLTLAVLIAAGFGLSNIVREIYAEEAERTQVKSEPSADIAEAEGLPTPEPAQTPTAQAAVLAPEQTEEPVQTPEPTTVSTPTPMPTPGPLDGLKIGIDPGHQLHQNNDKEPVKPGGSEKKIKVSSGTAGVSTKIPEYVTDLDISLKLKARLIDLGAEVLMTREVHDIDISNVERAQLMNEWGADVVLRIHCNGVDNKKSNGIGLYVKSNGENAQESYDIAKFIMPRMLEMTDAREDGIFKRDIYSGLNWSTVPSILVENGYMSNPNEDELLNDPAYQNLLVEGMVKGLADYFERGDMPPMEDEEVPTLTNDTYVE